MSVEKTGPLADLYPQAIEHWAAKWVDIGLWDEVLRLADRAWLADSDADKMLAWHHLLLAVGNFKRQSGRRIRVFGVPETRVATPQRPALFVPPRGEPIDVNEVVDWQRLVKSIPGVATPTCTTLLAALWPEDHFIFDWRVRAVASGLLLKRGQPRCPSVEDAHPKRGPGPVTMADYAVVRSHLKAARLALRDAERAMYQVSVAMPSQPGRTWENYSDMVDAAFSEQYLELAWA